MNKHLVMGVAMGYSVEKVKPFVISLRKHYDDYIVFVMSSVDEEMEKFCNDYNVYTFIPDEQMNLSTIIIDRHRYYYDCISANFEDVDSVLLADIRDIVFQDHPFKGYPVYDLEFFAEPEIFKHCNHNAPWIANVYGENRVKEIENEYVICCGTTLGTRSGILTYLETMINEIKNIESNGRKLSGGEDQPVHNHLVYNNIFTNFRINHNGKGLVSTMHHSKALTFNRQGQLLNDDGTPTPIVHQYDRCGPMSTIFLKNALNLKGREGILEPARYAVSNFYEHDLG
jgi:hypothetical protein